MQGDQLHKGLRHFAEIASATAADKLKTILIDIYRSAALLIQKHGDDAVIEAAIRADAMLDAGDLDGQRVWKAIVKAIEELGRGEPRDGERLM